jgi:hypothetical protein
VRILNIEIYSDIKEKGLRTTPTLKGYVDGKSSMEY